MRRTSTSLSAGILLGHNTNPLISNIYKILQSGYLKSGKETGITRFSGDRPELQEYIYLMVVGLNKSKTGFRFELDYELLLDNIFYLNVGWRGEPSDDAVKINGKKIDKIKLNATLETYAKKVKKINPKSEYAAVSHEILVSRKIDLEKYLRKIVISRSDIKRAKKTYERLRKLLKRRYPNVEVILER